jgi:hypothetical protein
MNSGTVCRCICDRALQELILFSRADLERSIPSVVDGLKPGQRKILYCCFKRNLKKDIKVRPAHVLSFGVVWLCAVCLLLAALLKCTGQRRSATVCTLPSVVRLCELPAL